MAICWEIAVLLTFRFCYLIFDAGINTCICVLFLFGVVGRMWNSSVSDPDQ